MLILSICLIIISVIIFIYSIYSIKKVHLINNIVDKENNKKEERAKELEQTINGKIDELNNIQIEINNKQLIYENVLNLKENELNTLNRNISDKQNQLDNIQKNVTKSVENQKQLTQLAFENYCEVLTKSYNEAEDEYNENLKRLQNSYSSEQEKILKELEEEKQKIAESLDQERQQLEKVRQTRAAAVQAQLKEKEIKEKLSFYCLQITESEKADINMLENIKPKLNNPRILSMLIWSTFFQKPMGSLCNNIIGTEAKSGIYKITNQINNICYIGQAVNLSDRWKQHAKCGLGIDTPAGNLLYKAMQKDGLWNFSFEVLEFCSSAELNEKEKYYIELYQSKDFGYNANKGVSK